MVKVLDYYEAHSDEQIVVDLGRRLNPEFFGGMQTDIDLVNWYLRNGTGSLTASSEAAEAGGATTQGATKLDRNWDDIVKAGGYLYDEFNDAYNKAAKGLIRPDGSVGYGTPSGRLELAPMLYKMWGLTPTPFHTEPVESPLSTPELMAEFPLILTCGGRSYEFFHSEHRQLATMRELHPLPLCMVNPKTAEKFGVHDGQWIWIENDHGRFRQVCKVTERVNEQTVHAEHGWWFHERQAETPSLFGTFECNPNNCTKAHETGEGTVGSSIKSMICKIYPYKEGDILPEEQIAKAGNFPQYVRTPPLTQDKVNAFHKAMKEGYGFDPLSKTLIDDEGNKRDLLTRKKIEGIE